MDRGAWGATVHGVKPPRSRRVGRDCLTSLSLSLPHNGHRRCHRTRTAGFSLCWLGGESRQGTVGVSMKVALAIHNCWLLTTQGYRIKGIPKLNWKQMLRIMMSLKPPSFQMSPGESQGQGRLSGGLPSLGLRRVGHDWSELAAVGEVVYKVKSYIRSKLVNKKTGERERKPVRHKVHGVGTLLVVQVLQTLLYNAGGVGSIPGQGARIPLALGPKNQHIKQKQDCNKFNRDFKNGPCKKKILLKECVVLRSFNHIKDGIWPSQWSLKISTRTVTPFPGKFAEKKSVDLEESAHVGADKWDTASYWEIIAENTP